MSTLEYRLLNKDKIKEYNALYYLENKVGSGRIISALKPLNANNLVAVDKPLNREEKK